MAMIPYNGNLLRPLKWNQNKAPNITSLLQQKSNWYSQFNTQYWNNFITGTFDLRTANNFGLYIWCVILGVPSQIFGLTINGNIFAFGPHRNNFIFKAGDTLPPGSTAPNLLGSNFAGGNSALLNLSEVRKALRMRYYSLISNGSIAFMNAALKDVFSNGVAWDFPGKKYFYVVDKTAPAQTLTPNAPVNSPFVMEYHIGANMGLSTILLNILNNPIYGIMPTVAGCKYTVIQDT